jgi:hypothetical protein
MEETQMDSIVITTGSPSANTSNEPNIDATRLRCTTLVLVLSQVICLASAGMVVVICTGLKYVPKKDQYTEDNTGEGDLNCVRGIVAGLIMMTIFGLFGFSVFVIQFISKIKSENPYFDRLRWGDHAAVSFALVTSILCIIFGASTKHEQGCVRFFQDNNPNYIFYMNFMIVYGTTTTIVDAVFILLSVHEFDWHQKNKKKTREDQEQKTREDQEQKTREDQEQKTREDQEQKTREDQEQTREDQEQKERDKKEVQKERRRMASESLIRRVHERRAQKDQEQKERDEKEVQKERRRMASESLIRQVHEKRAREKLANKKEMHLLDQNLVVAKRIETAVDDAVVSTTIRVSEIQETEGGSEFDVQCVTCRSEDPDHAFVPCGHTCVCESCAEVHKRRQDPCPICRGRQNGLIKIFK